jgi:molybdopterin-guanine dinucleotide biosynthesis protein A
VDEAGFDAVVLAGGGARRLGGVDKMALTVGGATLLSRVLDAVSGAGRTVAVGPRRELDLPGVTWCREQPAGGGPVAALAAGVTRTSAPVVVVLAGDLPEVAPAVPVLVGALGSTLDLAELVDAGGRSNHLAAAWRRAALVEALAALGDPAGASMRALVAGARRVGVPDPDGWGRDCDTWDQLAGARARNGDGDHGEPLGQTTRSSPA